MKVELWMQADGWEGKMELKDGGEGSTNIGWSSKQQPPEMPLRMELAT